jgi:hypothetical protein
MRLLLWIFQPNGRGKKTKRANIAHSDNEAYNKTVRPARAKGDREQGKKGII